MKSDRIAMILGSMIALGARGAGAQEPTMNDASCDDEGCAYFGECTRVGEHCAPASDRDCAGSELCREHGQCSFREGACVATRESMCRESSFCRGEGLCALRDGACAASDEACAASRVCSEEGRCEERGGVCVAPSDEACARSRGCTDAGRCARERDRCVARTDEACRASRNCARVGACARVGDTCAPTVARHCAASAACQRRGACGLLRSEGGHAYCGPRRDGDCPEGPRARWAGRWVCTPLVRVNPEAMRPPETDVPGFRDMLRAAPRLTPSQPLPTGPGPGAIRRRRTGGPGGDR